MSEEALLADYVNGVVEIPDNLSPELAAKLAIHQQAMALAHKIADSPMAHELLRSAVDKLLNQSHGLYQKPTVNAGFWWAHRRFVMVSNHPLEIHVEEVVDQSIPSRRLHNDSGPAMRWRDGGSFWFIHGVRVTEQIVMHPETLTPDQITHEENIEVRQIMQERYDAEVQSKNQHPTEGE